MTEVMTVRIIMTVLHEKQKQEGQQNGTLNLPETIRKVKASLNLGWEKNLYGFGTDSENCRFLKNIPE